MRLTGSVVLWLAHRSARACTKALTSSVFREVSGRAATHTRGFVLRAAPIVETLGQLADKGLAVNDPERLPLQLLAVLKANPGLSWVSYSDESGTFTGANRTPEGGLRISRSRIVDGRTQLVEHDVLPDGSLRVFRTDPDSGYDPRTRPFYVKPRQAGRLVWLPPYVFYRQGVPGISCAAPVTDAAGPVSPGRKPVQKSEEHQHQNTSGERYRHVISMQRAEMKQLTRRLDGEDGGEQRRGAACHQP